MQSHVVITPSKNEEKYIKNILDSMVAQTVRPIKWIIVDDNSTDRTGEIVRKYSQRHSWIKYVRSESQSMMRIGGFNVIDQFNCGLKDIENLEHDVISKIDSDLTLPADYFETILGEFSSLTRLGICGGHIVNKESNGSLRRESNPEHHVRGALKSYRRDCFKDIGGPRAIHNWDGIDEMMALYHGWDVRNIPIEVIHHRKTFTETNAGLKAMFERGRAYCRQRHDPLLMILKSIAWGIRVKPRILTGVSHAFGYIYSFIKNEDKEIQKDLARFIRKFQYNRILSYLKKPLI